MSNKPSILIGNHPCNLWGCPPRELIEIEIGARYRRLLLEASVETSAPDTDNRTLAEDLDTYEERWGVHDLHDELVSAKAEMEQQLQLLHARKYVVDEPIQTPTGGWGFRSRKARPGDLVMVPSWFMGTGRDEAEPEEARPDRPRKNAITRMDEERMMRAPRIDREEQGEWLTLEDLFDDRNAKALAEEVAHAEKRADAWDRLSPEMQRAVPRPATTRSEVALRVLSEYGKVTFDGTVTRMCADRDCTAIDLLRMATADAAKVKPKWKKGFLYLVRKGIRTWVEVPFKEYLENGYRVSPWHAVPENPTEY